MLYENVYYLYIALIYYNAIVVENIHKNDHCILRLDFNFQI